MRSSAGAFSRISAPTFIDFTESEVRRMPASARQGDQMPASNPWGIPAMAHSLMDTAMAAKNGVMVGLARVTAYWVGEDYYTSLHQSSTGVHLHVGHCAVDPKIIPYGSIVEIAGVGQFLAVDTGSAVISREAARVAGHSNAERDALVIDLFFEDRAAGEKFAASGPAFASIRWWTPSTAQLEAKVTSLFAEGDWNKIYSKQL